MINMFEFHRMPHSWTATRSCFKWSDPWVVE